jgi:hypothetical protein
VPKGTLGLVQGKDKYLSIQLFITRDGDKYIINQTLGQVPKGDVYSLNSTKGDVYSLNSPRDCV